MDRNYNYEIMEEMKKRWSPRAFSNEKIKEEDVMAILEAGRFAPSCFNEQPWRFIVSYKEEELAEVRKTLADSNKIWTSNVPVFITLIAKKTFELNGKQNYWHQFDCGTAWGYISLEADRRGCITHAMGGFNRELIKEKLNIPEDFDVMEIIALGKHGDINTLPEELKLREIPSPRKELESILYKGRYNS